MTDLQLPRSQLVDIVTALRQRIDDGLVAGGEIKALPSYFRRPRRPRGTAVVLDTGGTRMRGTLVDLVDPPGDSPPSWAAEDLVPRAAGTTARDFFDRHVDLIRPLSPPPNTPVGYCFSYPSTSTETRDARLLAWTKGIDIPGMVGSLVGDGLRQALTEARLEPGPVRVLNDTVAALLGGSFVQQEANFEAEVGLIAGTGTNMASYFRGPRWSGSMAINLESGNFDPPHRTDVDRAVDSASSNPGRQRFEKAVSGHYLPRLFARLCPDEPGFDVAQGSKRLVELRRGDGTARGAQVAAHLLDRSADLVAAGLAGVFEALSMPASAAVFAEGGLFWSADGYADRVRQRLADLTQNSCDFDILHIPQANLWGAACAALDD